LDIHEYQAKEILANFGVATRMGRLPIVRAGGLLRDRTRRLALAVKAKSIPAAAARRGRQALQDYNEVRAAAAELLGKTLVTNQTGPEARSYSESILRSPNLRAGDLPWLRSRPEGRAVRIIASRFGGMEIEEIAKEHPEEILQVVVEPAVGLQPFEARELAFGLGLTLKQVSRAVTSILGCYRAFRDLDATMVEINPLVVTKDDRSSLSMPRCRSTTMRCSGGIRCRHARPLQEDPREVQAAEHNLNYVGLDGNIGCMSMAPVSPWQRWTRSNMRRQPRELP